MYRIICAWCQKDLGAAPKGSTGDTHTVCERCKKEQDRLLAEMVAEQKRK